MDAAPGVVPRTGEPWGRLVFLIGIALLGLIAFGLGWALLGNLAGTLLVTFAWFGTEFDRFLTGLVIVGPALGAVCMVAAIWFSLRASGRCRTRREMLRAGGGALAIILGLGGTAWAANAVRMELYKAKYNLSYMHVAFELRLPAGTRVPAEKGDIRMTLSTPVLDRSPALIAISGTKVTPRPLSTIWTSVCSDVPIISAWARRSGRLQAERA